MPSQVQHAWKNGFLYICLLSSRKLLDENNHLIQCIMDFQSKGKTAECSQYQQMLHRNLVYLATIADSNQNMQSLLPAKSESPTTEVKHEPPSQNVPMGPGGMGQGGPQQPPHGHGGPPEGPPAPHIQGQMNGQMPGPNHLPMQGPGPNQPPNSSMSGPPSSHGAMGGYNHAGPPSQGMPPAQGQMNMPQGQPMGSYGPRPPMNMQPNQGPMMHQQPPSQQYSMPPGGAQHYPGQQNPMAIMGQVSQGNHVMGQRPMPPYRPTQPGGPQQYPGQEEYYGEQYSHGGQGVAEGNSQYSGQQEAYPQGPPQQQAYPPQQPQPQPQPPPQQQYPGQQGYPGQQQGYGPSQAPPAQYQNYPQGQGQQYGAYRPPQPGPPQAQPQRAYGYDQAQYGNYQQ
ncbi:protein SSXT-like isoform X2 [Conger conger]|uniref:protein SSXT-like isoform X2 n=1 Tax=Conger conger TaxID=82655 RepID=UPI002A5A3B8B|nr:protein SSXT-like isoform X2 [Conger conger]